MEQPDEITRMMREQYPNYDPMFADLVQASTALTLCKTCGQYGAMALDRTEVDRLAALHHNGGQYRFCLLCAHHHYWPDGAPEWSVS